MGNGYKFGVYTLKKSVRLTEGRWSNTCLLWIGSHKKGIKLLLSLSLLDVESKLLLCQMKNLMEA